MSTMLSKEELVHREVIGKVVRDSVDSDEKIIIYSGNSKSQEVAKKVLVMFSPVARALVASLPCCTPSSIIIPNSSPSVVQHLVDILESGYTTGVPSDSFKQVYEIIELAKTLGIDVSDLRREMKDYAAVHVPDQNTLTE